MGMDGGEGAAESLGQGFAINCSQLSFPTIEVDESVVVVALKSNWSYWGAQSSQGKVQL